MEGMDSLQNGTTFSTYDLSTVYTIMPPPERCRERHGEHHPAIYNILTCALCYSYVYAGYNVSMDYRTMELVMGTNTAYSEGTRIVFNPDSEESVDQICESLLDPSECWKWQECCRQARLCCQEQLEQGWKLYQENATSLCPHTWDGYACWPDTAAGQRPSTQCPGYVPAAETGRYAYKTCTQNATWYVNPISNKEWTDYTECTNMQQYHRLHEAAVTCNSITIVFLIPACIIFILYRPLRLQHRIRLHLCLMISSFMTSVSMLIWEIIIFKDRIESEDGYETTVKRNSVGCRVLYALTRYTELASFMWMFIEGFHLHRLLVHAFTVPKALLPYYIFGFGFPLLPVIVYSIIRGTNTGFNQKCWIENTGEYEWVIYVPSLTALLTNVFFLLRIVFIMVRQLEPHPNEPSNFRRAVKAVVVLVPLFGVQFLLFVYRPPGGEIFSQMSELMSKICSSLQGAFIAIIFCYCNKEVQGYLKTSCLRLLRRTTPYDASSRSITMTTQFGSEVCRTRSSNECGDSGHMIPLRPIYRYNGFEESGAKDTADEHINGNLHPISENVDDDVLLNHFKNSI